MNNGCGPTRQDKKFWSPKDIKFKNYSHFDAPISKKNVVELVTNPKKVTKHTFFPFLHFEETFQPYRNEKRPKRKPKTRPIRYAARGDSYIYSKYRFELSKLYELELANRKLTNVVSAYRKVAFAEGSKKNKSNIDFAKDVFKKITTFRDSIVVTADISSYFESIDHDRLYAKVKYLLKCDELPDDWAAVLRNLMNYKYMSYKEVCRIAGFFGPKDEDGYNTLRKKMPKQICPIDKYRELTQLVLPNGNRLLERNENSFGIPQGAPLSDLLANLYLLDFDERVNAFVSELGGMYCRYSDDIILVIPNSEKINFSEIEKFLQDNIQLEGDQLKIKPEKCAALRYFLENGVLNFEPLTQYDRQERKNKDAPFKTVKRFRMNNGLEYLGFRFDGQKVYLKDSTLSNLKRKIRRNAWRYAYKHNHDFRHLKLPDMIAKIDIETFFQKFGKVKKFKELQEQSDSLKYKSWTFTTYAKRASDTFGKQGDPILKQIKSCKKFAADDLRSKVIKVYSTKK